MDAELGAVPPLTGLADDALLLLLERAGEALASVHGYEMLAGLLPAPPQSAASVALEALASGRAQGLPDADVVAARPVVLALTAPAISRDLRLPAVIPGSDRASTTRRLDSLGPREALRLRARWLHELTVRVAIELGDRLAARGLLSGPGDVGLLHLAELHAGVREGLHADGPAGDDSRRLRLSPPPPPAFRLGPGQRVVAVGAGSRAGPRRPPSRTGGVRAGRVDPRPGPGPVPPRTGRAGGGDGQRPVAPGHPGPGVRRLLRRGVQRRARKVPDGDGRRGRRDHGRGGVPVDVGVHTVRKLHGCLEDAALDRVQAAVVTVRTDPPSG